MTFRRARSGLALLVLGIVAGATVVPNHAGATTARPTVTAVAPSAGPASGGTRVVVRGSGFTHVTAVRFGTTDVIGKQFSVESPHRLVVIAPAHRAEAVHVRVVAPAGTSPTGPADRFEFVPTPAVSAVAPSGGLPAGSTRVTVTGTNLGGATSVTFGATPGTAVTVLTSHRLRVTSPAHAAGAVHVRVTTPHGTSRATPADRFVYGTAPEPVTDLAVADTSATSATLRWTPSPSASVTGVVLRRAAGSIPPDSPEAGVPVAVVPAGTNQYLDSGLAPDTSYAYAAFAMTAAGPMYSSPTTVDVTTPPASQLPDFTTNPAPSTPFCAGGPYAYLQSVHSSELVLGTPIPAGGGSAAVQARFTLWDLGPSGAETPDYLLGPGDPEGLASPVSASGGYALVRMDGSSLVDGHLYGLQVDASDGAGFTVSSGPCHVWYDAGHPAAPTITPSKTTVHVGEHMRFDFATADATPADGGRASGIDHLTYSFSSAGELGGDSGQHLPVTVDAAGQATASLPYVPTVWGTHYLYVEAHDAAGNVSGVSYYSFYVQDA